MIKKLLLLILIFSLLGCYKPTKKEIELKRKSTQEKLKYERNLYRGK
jgi:hypothetical protein